MDRFVAGWRIVAGTNRKDPVPLGTLAAAYAEVGDFANALSAQKEAIALNKNAALIEGMKSRLKLYEAGSPYRERE